MADLWGEELLPEEDVQAKRSQMERLALAVGIVSALSARKLSSDFSRIGPAPLCLLCLKGYVLTGQLELGGDV